VYARGEVGELRGGQGLTIRQLVEVAWEVCRQRWRCDRRYTDSMPSPETMETVVEDAIGSCWKVGGAHWPNSLRSGVVALSVFGAACAEVWGVFVESAYERDVRRESRRRPIVGGPSERRDSASRCLARS
jgi:hypothetical protein